MTFRLRRWVAITTASLAALLCTRAGIAEQAVMGIADVIESSRLMIDAADRSVFKSPDGKHYAILRIRGDVAKDGVWAELLVGGTRSFTDAAPVLMAQLFTRGLSHGFMGHGGSYEMTWPTMNPPRWLDAQRIALFWEDAAGVRQVYALDITTRQLNPLTRSESDVTAFAVSEQGALIYSATVPCRGKSAATKLTGQVVGAADAYELIFGCGAWDRKNQRLYVIARAGTLARSIKFIGGDEVIRSFSMLASMSFSPDGQRVIATGTLVNIAVSAQWRLYTRPHLQNMLSEREIDPLGNFARQLQQLFVVDVASALARPLWNVPSNTADTQHVAWSPDGLSIIVAPTYLPLPQRDVRALSGEAIAEVVVDSGKVRQLPVTASALTGLKSLRWDDGSQVTLLRAAGPVTLVRRGDQWRGLATPASASEADSALRIEFRQDLNEPPTLFASDSVTQQQRLLLDVNPQLHKFAVGRVEWVRRRLADGWWQGRLNYPVNYQPGRRYPLVVQTHTFGGEHEYSLTGKAGPQPATGPGGSVYIAQPLAQRDVFVLHGSLQDSDDTRLLQSTQRQVQAQEAMIEALAAEGKIDRTRVGLMGHSASGWFVAYTLTHSQFPYAAAITDDNKDGGYLQAALSGWSFGLGEQMIAAPPFGVGLLQWLQHSPAMTVEHIRAPLLLTRTSDGMELGAWEMFSRMRYLRKPVEFFLVPDIEHGSHGLQNPHQILTLHQRALDWWCFWLKDEQDADPRKADQYAGWRQLRALRDRGSSAIARE